ncbi:MAG: hypothetical protein HKO63_04165 [Acidimicrobiia bacterium]|nr:hypothetical protein [Acidimicrobiia bacterium]MBT8193005.1 hypothetical protein [Acidimicrobiia bacterium]NNF89507.1 hypothetical protein [Acidimicrobiia bacterium]NNJ47448.1 hypothetical protein [Acidimicrobiia bacterium]NNL14716.1 hypothetical protein [Acidimicrobiia bacterium]
MVFVWSDDLALLLRDEGEASTNQLGHWIASPVGYRLPDDTDPVAFARRLLRHETETGRRRRAS